MQQFVGTSKTHHAYCTLLLNHGRQLTIQVFPLSSSKLQSDIQINCRMHTTLDCNLPWNYSNLRSRSWNPIYNATTSSAQRWVIQFAANELDQWAVQLMRSPAIPCNRKGNFLPLHTKPTPLPPADAMDWNVWHPFDDCLAFDFANFQFAKLQASESNINHALDLWMAASLKVGGNGDISWSSAKEMYFTIDAIQEGDVPWKTIPFKYTLSE